MKKRMTKVYGRGIRHICMDCLNLRLLSNNVPYCFAEYNMNSSNRSKCEGFNESEIPMITGKYCIKCYRIKDFSEFYKDSRYSDGYAPYCKECKRESVKIRYMKSKKRRRK